MDRCNVCDAALGEPIFAANSPMALTSLCELRPGQVRVWSCRDCAHLLGDALPDTEQYYETDYRILLDHDDEDQIYEVRDEQIVYRTEHQVATLLRKLDLREGALLLDYGCAKASTPKRLLAHRPDLRVHLFDVSDMYAEHWNRFVAPDRQATHLAPPDWQHKFDALTSFFALEHIPDPRKTVRHVASLLSDSGVFYGIVPDAFGNVADFVVIDHVNHFTAASLHRLLSDAGFRDIDIDADAHRGALVFVARMQGAATPGPDIDGTVERSLALAAYWAQASERIRVAERELPRQAIAIYGSGFYGAFIFSTLQAPEQVSCFLDRSPFQQGKTLFGTPILAPDQMPTGINTLFVGLNPAIARQTMAQTTWPQGLHPSLIFLDGA